MQDIKIYIEKANIDVTDSQSLERATSTLSWLNKQLDAITDDKEKLTKPLNTSLKAIRDKYRPYETTLTESINNLKQSITTYATNEHKRLQEQEKKILEDKRTTTDTKIQKLSTLDEVPTKAKTDQGSITFVTVKKYRVTNIDDVPRSFLHINDDAIKEAMKQNPQPTIQGIEFYEEQSLRNYR